jgi:hypothetical protein
MAWPTRRRRRLVRIGRAIPRSSAKSSIMIIISKSSCFFFFVVQQMRGLPLRLLIFATCSDGLTLVFHLRAFLSVIFTGLQVTSTFQLGERNKVLSCHPSPLALLARNVYFSCIRLRKFGFLSRRSSCSDRLSLMFLPHISAIGTLQLL